MVRYTPMEYYRPLGSALFSFVDFHLILLTHTWCPPRRTWGGNVHDVRSASFEDTSLIAHYCTQLRVGEEVGTRLMWRRGVAHSLLHGNYTSKIYIRPLQGSRWRMRAPSHPLHCCILIPGAREYGEAEDLLCYHSLSACLGQTAVVGFTLTRLGANSP